MRTLRIGPVLAVAVAVAGLGGPALAQESAADDFNDLTPPDMSAPRQEQEYRVCPDREPRPEWAEDLEVREAYKGVLLRAIYEARSYEAIVSTGDCSCANRAPSWDAAAAEYQEDFAHLDPQAQRGATRDFQSLKGDLRGEAKAICEAQGNW